VCGDSFAVGTPGWGLGRGWGFLRHSITITTIPYEPVSGSLLGREALVLQAGHKVL
jgi:hypothetical protein